MIHPTAVIGAPPFSFAEGSGVPAHANLGFIVADDAHVLPYAVVERGTARPTVVGAGCRIGPHVYIGHDARVGRKVWIAAGARVAGWVEVGDGAYLGMGCVVRQHLKIGAGALIGMGAVVVTDVPPNAVMAGNPARLLRFRSAGS